MSKPFKVLFNFLAAAAAAIMIIIIIILKKKGSVFSCSIFLIKIEFSNFQFPYIILIFFIS